MSKHNALANYLAAEMKDYAKGVAIFKDLRVDPSADAYFDVEKPTPMHGNLLKKKLLNYARVNKVKPAVSPLQQSNPAKTVHASVSDPKPAIPVPAGKQKLIVDTNPIVRMEDLPTKYQDMYREAGRMANEQKTFHAELKQLADSDDTTKERRAELSQMIVDSKKQAKALWAEIDAWWLENKDKTREQQIAESAVTAAMEKEKRIKANKTYIQRNYGNGKKEEEVAKRMKELDEWGIDYAEDIDKAGANKAG